MTASWRRWCFAAAEAGAGVGLVDAAFALGRRGEFLVGAANRAAFGLALVFVCACATALVVGVAFAFVAWVRRLPVAWHSAIAQLAGIALGLAFGFALFSGTAMRRSPARPWAILATSALAAFIAQNLWTRRASVARFAATHPRGTQLSLLIASVALYVAHAFVFVRLYAGLHAFAAAGAVASLVLALALSGSPRTRSPIAVTAVACAGAIGAAWVLHSDAQRALVRTRAPIASYVFATLGRFVPREPSAAIVRDDRIHHGPHLDFAGLDVVLVTVDALRADRLGTYGNTRGLTPTIDALASRGLVVEHAYCTTPHTSYAIASLMTGKFFHEVSALGAPARPHETLAVLMSSAGFSTAAFFPPAVFNVDGERLGELRDRAFGFEARTIDWSTASERVHEVERFLDQLPTNRRTFVWIHFFEPHEPYEAQPGATSREPEDLYDGEIATVDAAVDALEQAFARHGRRVAWVVTGDHGEEFGEHGGRFHGTSVYEEQVRVPLVIAAPGVPARRIAGPVSHVDVMPTLLGAVGIARPPRLRGRDIGPAAHGDAGDAEMVFASAENARMVARGDERLICDVGEGSCELYDLRTDPTERSNLVDARSADVAQLRPLLRGWMESHETFEHETDAAAANVPAALERVEQGDRGAATELAHVLGALDPVIASRAAHALGDLGVADGAVRDALAELASKPGDAFSNARDEAALALALLGDAGGSGRARAGLVDPDAAVARRAALGLARLGSTDGVTLLDDAARDTHAPDAIRANVVDALTTLHDPRSFDTFAALLDDPRFGPQAAHALGLLGNARAVPILENAVRTSRFVLTRAQALDSLAHLADPAAPSLFIAALGATEALPGAFALAADLHEPGRMIAGAQDPVHLPARAGVTLRGQLPHGASWAIVRVRANEPCTLSLDDASVLVPPGEREIRLPWRRASAQLFLRANAPVDVLAAMVVPREP